jgi:hypothetical protein
VKEGAGFKKIEINKSANNKDKSIKFNVKTKDLPHIYTHAAKENVEYDKFDKDVEIKAGEKEASVQIKINYCAGEAEDKLFEVIISNIKIFDGAAWVPTASLTSGDDLKCTVTVIDDDKDENEFKKGIDEMYNLQVDLQSAEQKGTTIT